MPEAVPIRIEGYYVAEVFDTSSERITLYVPDLPACSASGATADEAFGKLKALVPAFLSDLRRQGLALPQPSDPAVSVAAIHWFRAGGMEASRKAALRVERAGAPIAAFADPVPTN